jgi:hypothetical protein
VDYQEQISEAYQLYKQGQGEMALFILRKIVGQAPTETTAWWGVAVASKNPAEKRRAVERVLMLAPEHRGARKMLARLETQHSSATPRPHPRVKAQGRSSKIIPQSQTTCGSGRF